MMGNNSYQETLLGSLPKDWDMVPLGDVFEPVNIKLKDYDNSGMGIPVLSMTRSEGLILQTQKFDKRVASRDTSNYKIVKRGQLVYGFPIDEGVIAILHRYPIGAVSPAYQVWNPIREIDLVFIDYMLKTPAMINVYKMFSSTVVERRRNLAQRDFVRVVIPLPPLPEQRAIAHVLSTVRQSIEATERVIAAARELKRSLMKYLFTYGPVPIDQADQVVLKETDVGEVPEEWQIIQVNQAIQMTQYGRNERASSQGAYPILRMNNLKEGGIDISDLKYIDLDEHEIGQYRLKVGDILFNRTNSFELVGKTSLFNLVGSYTFASYLVRVVLNRQKMFPEYLNHYMNWEGTQSRLKSLATRGVSQSNISASKLRGFLITMPPLDIQESTNDFLASIDNKVRSEICRKIALEALFNSLLHHLMTGRVRVTSLLPASAPEDADR